MKILLLLLIIIINYINCIDESLTTLFASNFLSTIKFNNNNDINDDGIEIISYSNGFGGGVRGFIFNKENSIPNELLNGETIIGNKVNGIIDSIVMKVIDNDQYIFLLCYSGTNFIPKCGIYQIIDSDNDNIKDKIILIDNNEQEICAHENCHDLTITSLTNTLSFICYVDDDKVDSLCKTITNNNDGSNLKIITEKKKKNQFKLKSQGVRGMDSIKISKKKEGSNLKIITEKKKKNQFKLKSQGVRGMDSIKISDDKALICYSVPDKTFDEAVLEYNIEVLIPFHHLMGECLQVTINKKNQLKKVGKDYTFNHQITKNINLGFINDYVLVCYSTNDETTNCKALLINNNNNKIETIDETIILNDPNGEDFIMNKIDDYTSIVCYFDGVDRICIELYLTQDLKNLYIIDNSEIGFDENGIYHNESLVVSGLTTKLNEILDKPDHLIKLNPFLLSNDFNKQVPQSKFKSVMCYNLVFDDADIQRICRASISNNINHPPVVEKDDKDLIKCNEFIDSWLCEAYDQYCEWKNGKCIEDN